MKAVREEDKAGLQAQPHTGAPPKLSPTELALLPELLAAGAETYGFRGAVWSCARVAKVKDFLAEGWAKYIHLERFPVYAPELNPDEGVWQHLKHVELRNEWDL